MFTKNILVFISWRFQGNNINTNKYVGNNI